MYFLVSVEHEFTLAREQTEDVLNKSTDLRKQNLNYKLEQAAEDQLQRSSICCAS